MANNEKDKGYTNKGYEIIYDNKNDAYYTHESLITGIKNHTAFTSYNEDNNFVYNNSIYIDDSLFKENPNGFDIKKACIWLINNSYNCYIKGKCGKCAKYVRMALEAGGLSTAGRPTWAWKYINYLPTIGFKFIGKIIRNNSTFTPKPGDIAVYQKNGDPSVPGHICMWTGHQWISDFKQSSVFVYSGTNEAYIFRFGEK